MNVVYNNELQVIATDKIKYILSLSIIIFAYVTKTNKLSQAIAMIKKKHSIIIISPRAQICHIERNKNINTMAICTYCEYDKKIYKEEHLKCNSEHKLSFEEPVDP